MRSTNRLSIQKRIENEDSNANRTSASNVELLRKQLHSCDDIEKKARLLESMLFLIENFFTFLNGQSEILRAGGSIKNFEALLEDDLETVLVEIEAAKYQLSAAAPAPDLAVDVVPRAPTADQEPSDLNQLNPPSHRELQEEVHDLFLSHASEDKDAIARPLYEALIAKGVSVWFDEATLELGDSLRRKIDKGLAKCRYGVVILSPKFLSKQWPQRELDGLVARETETGDKAILPIWHELDHETLSQYSPTLADRLAAKSEQGVDELVNEILRVLRT
jgi:hypothetical protein